MKKAELRIGLALSGGGMRAAVFHLGVMKYLAEQGLLTSVAKISTVSGGSICIGLLYARNGYKWPDNQQYLTTVLPAIKRDILYKDIQWSSLIRLLFEPYYWDKKVNLLSKVMEKKWDIRACLQDVEGYPLWIINTTSFESGKDFRISTKWMGSKNCRVMRPQMKVTHAMGASAGFPVLIGPYKLKTANFTWSDRTGTITIRPKDKKLHLWDGGVYDNMGLDPLFHTRGNDHMVEDINYMIVSNASSGIEYKARKGNFSITNLKRLLDINMDQVESLKSSAYCDSIQKNKNGVYLKIGSSVQDIIKKSTLSLEEKVSLTRHAMNCEEVQHVADYKTSLERVSKEDFEKILRHGYEIAHASFVSNGYLTASFTNTLPSSCI